MPGPIKPNEVASVKAAKVIPELVFEAFNLCIARNWKGSSATVLQSDVVKEIVSRLPEGRTKQEIFDNNWLDVEDAYREAGWKVVYDKPGFNESYEANFIFSKK